jgi:hypothetical protein
MKDKYDQVLLTGQCPVTRAQKPFTVSKFYHKNDAQEIRTKDGSSILESLFLKAKSQKQCLEPKFSLKSRSTIITGTNRDIAFL